MYNDVLDNSKFEEREVSRTFMSNVFMYMFGALLISGVISWYLGNNMELFLSIFATETGMSPLFYVVMFSPLAISLVMQMTYQRFSMPLLFGLFLGFAVLMGMSLSTIFYVYTTGSIVKTFLITAVTYGAVAVLGYTTSLDLRKFGSIMYMLFIGIFIAGLVNFFTQSETLDYIISFIGIFVFTGLTAYHLQQLKHISQDPDMVGIPHQKLALIGGLQLYILFINLFMSLLRFFGDRE